VGIDGLDHRVRMAVRSPEGPDDGRSGRDHLVGDRRRDTVWKLGIAIQLGYPLLIAN